MASWRCAIFLANCQGISASRLNFVTPDGIGRSSSGFWKSIASAGSGQTPLHLTSETLHLSNSYHALQIFSIFFSSRRRHTRSVSAFLLNRSSDLLSKQQQVSEIMRQMLTQAQTAGQYFTNDQIKEMTRKVSAEVDLVHQQTQNQRYGSSHIGATAKDISNVVTDAASGVVDIFHGIDKAVADTWNNFWKDGKADGIGSNLSRK